MSTCPTYKCLIYSAIFVGIYPREGVGYSYISYVRRLGSFLGVQNFEFQCLFDSEKLIFSGCVDLLWIFLGVISKLDYI